MSGELIQRWVSSSTNERRVTKDKNEENLDDMVPTSYWSDISRFHGQGEFLQELCQTGQGTESYWQRSWTQVIIGEFPVRFIQFSTTFTEECTVINQEWLSW